MGDFLAAVGLDSCLRRNDGIEAQENPGISQWPPKAEVACGGLCVGGLVTQFLAGGGPGVYGGCAGG